MEWSRVKSILISLLLAANIILGVNIANQVIRVRAVESKSLQNACTLLAQRGVKFETQIFSEMPKKMEHYSGSRSVSAEKKVVAALLGEYESEEAGGGITKYSAEGGRAVFRSGGLFELEIFEYDGTEQQLLNDAGLKTSQGEDGYILKIGSDLPVINATLNVTIEGGNAKIVGQWIFSEDLKSVEQSAPRSELILAILAMLEESPTRSITSVAPIYFVQEERASRLSIVPAWQVELDSGTVYVNAITKKQFLF